MPPAGPKHRAKKCARAGRSVPAPEVALVDAGGEEPGDRPFTVADLLAANKLGGATEGALRDHMFRRPAPTDRPRVLLLTWSRPKTPGHWKGPGDTKEGILNDVVEVLRKWAASLQGCGPDLRGVQLGTWVEPRQDGSPHAHSYQVWCQATGRGHVFGICAQCAHGAACIGAGD